MSGAGKRAARAAARGRARARVDRAKAAAQQVADTVSFWEELFGGFEPPEPVAEHCDADGSPIESRWIVALPRGVQHAAAKVLFRTDGRARAVLADGSILELPTGSRIVVRRASK